MEKPRFLAGFFYRKRKKRFFEKKRAKNFYELGAFAPGVPIIATDDGDYRHSRCKRPQEQKTSFSSEKEDLPSSANP